MTTNSILSRLNPFQAASRRKSGQNKTAGPAGRITEARAGTAAAVHRPAVGPPRAAQRVPAAVAPREAADVPSKRPAAPPPGSLAKVSLEELLHGVKSTVPAKGALDSRLKDELERRGISVAVMPAVKGIHPPRPRFEISRSTFDAMGHAERNELYRGDGESGNGLVVIRRKSAGDRTSPTEYAKRSELEFPTQPPDPRPWRTFWNFSAAQVEALARETARRGEGALARQELFDAYSSMAKTSWRSEGGGEDSKTRTDFHLKFRESMGHISQMGPLFETPNDPAPPVDPNAMGVMDFLALPAEAAERLIFRGRLKSQGRNLRAELKRAYRAASSAQKEALRGKYDEVLTAFPEEWI